MDEVRSRLSHDDGPLGEGAQEVAEAQPPVGAWPVMPVPRPGKRHMGL